MALRANGEYGGMVHVKIQQQQSVAAADPSQPAITQFFGAAPKLEKM